MSLHTHLRFAQQAVDYTKSKMGLGASNKIDSLSIVPVLMVNIAMIRYACTEIVGIASQITTDGFIEDELAKGKMIVGTAIALRARRAEQMGCGNCGEQSAIAYVYLAEQVKLKNLDLMHRVNADHAFVVIGRKNGSLVSDYKTWGDKAVICDPWAESVYPCQDIPIKMYNYTDNFAPKLDDRVAG